MTAMPDPALLGQLLEEICGLCAGKAAIRDMATGEMVFGRAWPDAEDAVHPEDWARYVEAVGGDGPLKLAYREADGVGGWREMEATARSLSVGGRTYRLLAAIDVTERREAERARSRYRAILDSHVEFIVRQTPDGRNSYVNEAYCRWKWMTREELTAPDYDHAGPLLPESRALFEANRARLGPDLPALTCEVRTRHPDGSLRWQVWTDMAILDEAGRIVEYQAIGREITEQKRTELALRASEAQLRAVLDTQTEWVVRQAPDGRNTYVNPAYCRYMGKTAAELTAPDHYDLTELQAEHRERFLANRASLGPERPSSPVVVAYHRHQDGQIHWESWIDTAIFDEAGRIVAYQSVGRDVTEERQALAALAASEARYRDLVEMQNELVTRIRPDGRLTFVNDAYCRYIGMTRAQLLDPGWDDLSVLSAEERAALHAEWAQLTPRRPTSSHVCKVTLPDGRRRVESWDQRGIFDPDGRLAEVQGVGRDITEELQRERDLRESEARLRAIIDTQTEWLTREGLDGRYTFVNPAYCRYRGLSEAELTAPDFDDYASVVPEDRARYTAARRELTPERPTFTVSIRVRYADGLDRTEEWTETALFDAEGRVREYQAVGRDVTVQRRTEEALRASEAYLRGILETQHEWVTRRNAGELPYTYVNEAYCRYMGMTREQLMDPDFYDGASVVPEDLRRWYDLRARRTPAQPAFTIEILCRHPDGSMRIEEWTETAIFDAAGEVREYQAVGRDVTVQRRTEEALRESEQRFRRFAEAHPVPLCALTAGDWRVLFVNEAYLTLFQLTWEELDKADKRTQWADASHRQPYYERLVRDEATDNVEVILKRKDGTTFPALMSSRLMRFGETEAVVNSVVDLTRQRAAEAEIVRQREMLHRHEKMAALASLLAGVAHELNNPLSVVQGYASILRNEARSKLVREQATKIHTAAERCTRIVKAFLAMAREKPPAFGPVEVGAAIQGSLEFAAYGLRTSGTRVVTHLAPDLPPVYADADQLHQVLTNLIVNAKQALQDIDGPRRLKIRAAVMADRGFVRITVADNGPGIPSEMQRRVFEPFFTTKPQGLGTGLGLAVCHGIVTAHGGSIEVESAPGQGTRVTVRLPVARPAEDAAGAEPGFVEPTARVVARILVVDDEVEVARLVSRTLAEDGHLVESVADGRAALARIGKGGIDLVISDLRMPEMDGSTFLRALRATHPDLARTALILTGDVLSAEGNPELRQEQVLLLEKPIDPAELRRAVQRRLLEETLS